jgi:two-component system sensor histidine kinase KdpD
MPARLSAVYVETPRGLLLPEQERNRAIDNLRLAEQLGAETFTLTGRNVAEETMRFARERGMTRIIAGKPGLSRLKSIFLGSPVDLAERGIPLKHDQGGPGMVQSGSDAAVGS